MALSIGFNAYVNGPAPSWTDSRLDFWSENTIVMIVLDIFTDAEPDPFNSVSIDLAAGVWNLERLVANSCFEGGFGRRTEVWWGRADATTAYPGPEDGYHYFTYDHPLGSTPFTTGDYGSATAEGFFIYGAKRTGSPFEEDIAVTCSDAYSTAISIPGISTVTRRTVVFYHEAAETAPAPVIPPFPSVSDYVYPSPLPEFPGGLHGVTTSYNRTSFSGTVFGIFESPQAPSPTFEATASHAIAQSSVTWAVIGEPGNGEPWGPGFIRWG